jgi:sugar/nucleoside kinase (ribokinase family)
VQTDGAGGCVVNGRHFPAVPAPGPVVDTYGAGDSFAAALCFALARGDDLPAAIELAARAGASVITGEGPYATQLALDS